MTALSKTAGDAAMPRFLADNEAADKRDLPHCGKKHRFQRHFGSALRLGVDGKLAYSPIFPQSISVR